MRRNFQDSKDLSTAHRFHISQTLKIGPHPNLRVKSGFASSINSVNAEAVELKADARDIDLRSLLTFGQKSYNNNQVSISLIQQARARTLYSVYWRAIGTNRSK